MGDSFIEEVSIKQTSVRFSEAPFYQPNVEVLILGVGGIGSWLALNLARLECNVYMYDMDTVDEVNLAGQFYNTYDVGRSKVDAVYNNVVTFSDNSNIVIYNEEYTSENGLITPIMFSCFDNMKARKIAFDNWKSQEDRELFIDGRMALVTGEVYCVLPGREKEYEETLFLDSEVEDAPCSLKATTFSGMQISSLMTALFTNYISIKKDKDMPFSLPFKTDYNFPLMIFNTHD